MSTHVTVCVCFYWHSDLSPKRVEHCRQERCVVQGKLCSQNSKASTECPNHDTFLPQTSFKHLSDKQSGLFTAMSWFDDTSLSVFCVSALYWLF